MITWVAYWLRNGMSKRSWPAYNLRLAKLMTLWA